MIMDLPKEFYYGSPVRAAYIENGELKVRRDVHFEKLVKDLTFNLYQSKHQCVYCGKKTENKKMTIDHLYPQTMGGPTITNNLVPACTNCNSDKTDMNLEEFIEWCEIPTEKGKKKFLNELRKKKEEIRIRKEYQIPNHWISKRNITTILVDIKLEDSSQTKKYKKAERFYETYGYFQKPIVVDKNGFLLDGYNSVILAKNYHISKIPIIELDNVEVILK